VKQNIQVLAQDEGSCRNASYSMISLHQFQELNHENEGGEKPTCGDQNDTEEQWQEGDAMDWRTNGAYDYDGKRETLANQEER